MSGETGPLKVFLWTSPRTVSTSFLKCMNYVPDTVAWHEPYMEIAKFSQLTEDPMVCKPCIELLEKHGGASEVAKIKSGYDASDKDFDWLKEQLEGDFPGKKMVFVKEMAASLVRESRYDKIPKGFRHTFLIRNPHKLMKSQLKVLVKSQKGGSDNMFKKNRDHPNRVRPLQYLNELWKYVKAEGLESRPVIIDIDDLLENPKEMLEAYCKEVGIPFTEDLLTWPAGDDVMTKIWMVPKQTILTFRSIGLHDATFASTGFQTKSSTANGDSSSAEAELTKQVSTIVPPMWKSTVSQMLDREMPYYEELHAERLTLEK
ncbi:uncharacterized protein [Amphiura filiformis]|uniref:uncharacterized protein n=1 Tax=Amphiura filiformis TaxID=82378 RepID=UPI003B22113B